MATKKAVEKFIVLNGYDAAVGIYPTEAEAKTDIATCDDDDAYRIMKITPYLQTAVVEPERKYEKGTW